MVNKIDKFLSEDKMHIDLPVPLGTTLYEFRTTCNNCCLDYPKEVLPYVPHECDYEALCHTKFKDVVEVAFTEDSIMYVLKYYGQCVFNTPEEAESVGRAIAEKHKVEFDTMLKELGIEKVGTDDSTNRISKR